MKRRSRYQRSSAAAVALAATGAARSPARSATDASFRTPRPYAASVLEVTVEGDPAPAWADTLRTRQIVRNLLTNAHRYGCQQRATLQLTYECDALRIEIDGVLARRRGEIERILDEYGVPRRSASARRAGSPPSASTGRLWSWSTMMRSQNGCPTGVSRGSTSRVARGAREGAAVAGTSPTESKGQETIARVEKLGGKAFYWPGDAANSSQMKTLIDETARHLGGIDIVVNSGGVRTNGSITDITEHTNVERRLAYAAEHDARDQHRELDRRADDADRTTPPGDAGHQPVPRARSESRPDVQAGGDRQEHQAPGEQKNLCPQHGLSGDQPQAEFGARADQQHVQHGSDTRFLTDRDPEQEHRHPDQVGDQPEREPGLDGDSLGEHVPG